MDGVMQLLSLPNGGAVGALASVSSVFYSLLSCLPISHRASAFRLDHKSMTLDSQPGAAPVRHMTACRPT